MLTKKAALNKHAKKRAVERFGVKLNRDDIFNLVSKIRANTKEVTFVKTLTNRVTAWKVDLPGNNEQAIALYDKNRKAIITFLPTNYEI